MCRYEAAMIKAEVTGTSNLKAMSQQLPAKFRQSFQRQIRRDVAPAVNAALVRDLADRTPPSRTPQSPRFIWSRSKGANDRARRWWFANIKSGKIPTDGHNYIRTGKLQKAWRVTVLVNPDSAVISVTNKSKGAVYVYGNQQRPQIPGHRTTGWPSLARQLAGKRRTLDASIRRIAGNIVKEALKG